MFAGRARQRNVSVMNRIEGSAEKPDIHASLIKEARVVSGFPRFLASFCLSIAEARCYWPHHWNRLAERELG